MLKRYTFWLSAAVLFQIITGAVHALSLFSTSLPVNETERQIIEMMTTYRWDAGAGFHPTFFNLFTAYSSCFTFLCLFAGLTNGYLLMKHTEPNVMRGIVAINVAIFGPVFVVLAVFGLPVPVFLSGLILVNLVAALFLVPKIESAI